MKSMISNIILIGLFVMVSLYPMNLAFAGGGEGMLDETHPVFTMPEYDSLTFSGRGWGESEGEITFSWTEDGKLDIQVSEGTELTEGAKIFIDFIRRYMEENTSYLLIWTEYHPGFIYEPPTTEYREFKDIDALVTFLNDQHIFTNIKIYAGCMDATSLIKIDETRYKEVVERRTQRWERNDKEEP